MRHVSPITHKLSALFKCTNLGYQPRIHRIRSTFDNHVSFCRLFCNFLIAFWLLCTFLLSLPVICFRASILVCHKLITFGRPLTFSGAASVDKLLTKLYVFTKFHVFLFMISLHNFVSASGRAFTSNVYRNALIIEPTPACSR